MKSVILQNLAKGFTLIELMVVVAIIGILSSIAVVNFRNYQAKTKQSEAKILLAGIYNLEASSMAEYDSYTTCLGALGFETAPKGYYRVGFGAPEVANVSVRNFSCTAVTYAWDPVIKLKAGSTFPAAANMPITSLSSAGTSFTVGAAGNIQGVIYDTWTITDTKQILNVNRGHN